MSHFWRDGTREWDDRQLAEIEAEEALVREYRFSELGDPVPQPEDVRGIYFALFTVLLEVWDPRHVEDPEHDPTTCAHCLAVEKLEVFEGKCGIGIGTWEDAVATKAKLEAA